MAKVIDRDGTWRFVGNPITKECVRPYLGKNIDPDGTMGLEPDKVYNVYRPWSELSKAEALQTFNGKPFRNEHEMVGTAEGITSTDDTQVGGSIYNARPAEDGSHVIVADLTIFSKEIQDLIESGKKELSLGYFCDYRKESGTFDGQAYDFVQCDIEGNHIALVDRGRMGRDVRVFDKAITFDSMEIPEMKNKAKDAEKSVADEVAELLKGASDEQMNEIKKLLSKDKCGDEDDPEKKKGSDEEPKDDKKGCDEDKPDDKKGEDEDDPKKSKDEDDPKKGEKKDGEDEDEPDDKKGKDEDDEPKKKDKTGEDSAIATMDAAIAEVTLRNEIHDLVKPLIGDFDCRKMDSRATAKYACDKLDIDCGKFDEVAILNAYLAGMEKGKGFKHGMDGDDTGVSAEMSPALKEYLK
jgi:hypothetical protein